MKRILLFACAFLALVTIILSSDLVQRGREITRLEGEIRKFEIERTQIDKTVKAFAPYCMAAYATNDCIRACVEVDYETTSTP